MTISLGLTSLAASALKNLENGGVKTKTLPVKAGATPSIGQVLTYDNSTDNYADYASYTAGDIIVIFADVDVHVEAGTALAAETQAVCIHLGEVNRTALDSTSKADADIEAALLGNGINASTAIDA